MQDTRGKFLKQTGVTLIELLVIVSIIVVISTIALMSFGSSKNQLNRQNVARELKIAFERARFDSVKRRTQSGVQANVLVEPTLFTLKTDLNQNGTLENAENRVNSSWNPSISIRRQDGTPLSSNVTVAFNNRGETITTGGIAVFLVCNGDCSTPNSSNSNLVLVTATGTVNILSGGTTAPTFAAPSVSPVPPNYNIQPLAKVN